MKILLTDDHPVVRRGLKELLREEGHYTVAEASTGQEALDYVKTHACDVVVLDISMPGMNGLEALKLIHSERPELPVLMLSIYPCDRFAMRALRGGAAGYLCKEASPDELVRAVRKVHAGGRYVSPEFAERLADESAAGPTDRHGHERLTDREFEVLRALASGRTVSQVARGLDVSVKTVSTHRANLLRKLGLETTADLIKYALEQGLI